MNGTYNSPGGSVVDITRSGTPDAWITYRAFPGHKPKIKHQAWNAFHVINGASYIEINGFEIEGSIRDTTLAYCQNLAISPDPVCNGNGIYVNGRSSVGQRPAHIRIINNHVHHNAGGGIAIEAADYVTIENNIVHDNSWYTRYATSGISVLRPFERDVSTGYKYIIRGNQAWNNKTLVPWAETVPLRLSDGNGIIIDTTGPLNSNGAYRGRFLISNNLTFRNGGAGIISFQADNVDIFNNTSYENGTVLGWSDIGVSYGRDVNVINNIMYARVGGRTASNQFNTQVTFDHNIYFNGTGGPYGPNDVRTDPRLVRPSGDPLVADFRLQPDSPAIDSGRSLPAVGLDFNGVSRPQGDSHDRGAFERLGGAANLLVNGDFEAGTLSGWFVYQNAVIDTNNPIAGRFSVRAGAAAAGGGAEQRVVARPGFRYTLRASGRVQNNIYHAVSYTFYDASGKALAADVSLERFNSSNSQRTASFIAPEAAVALKVSFWTSAGGVLHIDALRLTAEDPNLLFNSGFETGDFTGWVAYPNTSLATASPIAGAYTVRAGTSSGGGGAEQSRAVTPGQRLTLSARGRSANGVWNALSYSFFDASGNRMGEVTHLPRFPLQNTLQSREITVPSGASSIRVAFWTNAGGTLFIDDVRLFRS